MTTLEKLPKETLYFDEREKRLQIRPLFKVKEVNRAPKLQIRTYSQH